MAFWQVDPANATEPAVVELAPGEARTLTLDTARYGAPGRRALAATLTDLDTGRVVPLPAPTLHQGVLSLAVSGLEAGHDYALWWSWVVVGAERPRRRTIIRGLPMRAGGG